MKIVSREQLLQYPKGTIFFERHKNSDTVDLMRFEGPLMSDFLQSQVGPFVVDASYSRKTPYRHLTINTESGREGFFDDAIEYCIMEPMDIVLLVRQLLGFRVGEGGDGLPDEDFGDYVELMHQHLHLPCTLEAAEPILPIPEIT